MKLVLMRHSDRDHASGLPEQKQPLTKSGTDKATVSAGMIKKNLSRNEVINRIFSSPYRPAIDTADVVRSCLNISQKTVLENCLAPANSADVDAVIELLVRNINEQVVLLVGHQPQLSAIAKRLSSKIVSISRAGVCCLFVINPNKTNIVAWQFSPECHRKEEPMKIDLKLGLGVFFFLMDLATFVLGIVLLFAGLEPVASSGGGGGIHLTIKEVGEITGVNGHMIIFLAGIAMILAAMGYFVKACKEAMTFERGLRDTIRHFSPF